jgi:hypothetical protein
MATLTKFRLTIMFVIVGLVISGVTAFPLLWELNILASIANDGSENLDPASYTGIAHWILKVREGLDVTYGKYPFIGYGTDWLAFGHIIIALFFILPYREPVRYGGVLKIGVVSCVLVIPIALICGPIRGIPFYWQLIDSAFGVVCVFPLLYAIKLTRKMEEVTLAASQ